MNQYTKQRTTKRGRKQGTYKVLVFRNDQWDVLASPSRVEGAITELRDKAASYQFLRAIHKPAYGHEVLLGYSNNGKVTIC